MTDPNDDFTGEERTRRRNRYAMILIGAGVLLGAVTGGIIAFATDGNSFSADAEWPPMLAAIAVGLYAVIGPPLIWLAYGTADDFELANQARGFEVGAWALMFAYPVWYGLWKGGFVPEPSHVALFFGFFLAVMAGYVVERLR